MVNITHQEIFQLAEKYGNKYQISPHLVFGVIMTESSGNPNADSGYQRGLMQMSKFQLIDINRVYGTSFTYDDMFDPEMAVDAGTQYLQYWMKYWHKLYASEYVATHLSLLTYAWGIGNVMNWLAKTPKDNQFIDESIPRDKKDYGENVTFWTVYSMYTFLTKDLDDISLIKKI